MFGHQPHSCSCGEANNKSVQSTNHVPAFPAAMLREVVGRDRNRRGAHGWRRTLASTSPRRVGSVVKTSPTSEKSRASPESFGTGSATARNRRAVPRLSRSWVVRSPRISGRGPEARRPLSPHGVTMHFSGRWARLLRRLRTICQGVLLRLSRGAALSTVTACRCTHLLNPHECLHVQTRHARWVLGLFATRSQ
jgi:hypothetical protein